jgi:hypothetical protein
MIKLKTPEIRNMNRYSGSIGQFLSYGERPMYVTESVDGKKFDKTPSQILMLVE